MLPVAFLITVFAGFPEIPEVGEHHGCIRQTVGVVDHGERHLAIAFEEGEANAVAVGEHHYIIIGERRHFVGDEDPPSDFPRGGNLRAEHFEAYFFWRNAS